MAEAVAMADREHRMARRHLLHELRRRRGGAAVMGHEQRVHGQQRGRAQQKLALGGALDVSCEQNATCGGFDPQYAALVVRARCTALGSLRARVEEFEGDSTRARRLPRAVQRARTTDRKSTRLNSSHSQISYAVFCLKKKIEKKQ